MPSFDSNTLSDAVKDNMVDFCKHLLNQNYQSLQHLAADTGVELNVEEIFPLIILSMAAMVSDKDKIDGCLIQMNDAQLVVFHTDANCTPSKEEDTHLQLRELVNRTIQQLYGSKQTNH